MNSSSFLNPTFKCSFCTQLYLRLGFFNFSQHFQLKNHDFFFLWILDQSYIVFAVWYQRRKINDLIATVEGASVLEWKAWSKSKKNKMMNNRNVNKKSSRLFTIAETIYFSTGIHSVGILMPSVFSTGKVEKYSRHLLRYIFFNFNWRIPVRKADGIRILQSTIVKNDIWYIHNYIHEVVTFIWHWPRLLAR